MKVTRLLFAALICALPIAMSAPASADGGWNWPGTFVAATLDNTTSVNGASWYNPSPVLIDGQWDEDYLWSPRIIGGDLHIFYSTGQWQEDCPRLVTTITGLNASSTYAVSIAYDKGYYGSNCYISTGFSQDSMVSYTGLTGDMVIGCGGVDYGGTGDDYWVTCSKMGDVTGVTSLTVFVDDGDHAWGLGTHYAGVILNETPVPEPSSILSLAGGLVGVFSLIRRRRNY